VARRDRARRWLIPSSLRSPRGCLSGFLRNLNGMLIAYGGLQPFIVTLGTLSLFRALALIYTGGNPILGVPSTFRRCFASEIGVLPSSGGGGRGARRHRLGAASPAPRSANTSRRRRQRGGRPNQRRADRAHAKIAAYANSGFLAALAPSSSSPGSARRSRRSETSGNLSRSPLRRSAGRR